MSLTVPPDLQAKVVTDEPAEEDFLTCVRSSLPYAYGLVAALADDLSHSDREYADNLVPPPDEQARGELLRALASDAIRGALERHFRVKLAFQNCHRLATFRPDAAGGATYAEFTSARAQLLNQMPELVNC